MKTIQLTDTEARIGKIETNENGVTTVDLIWGGPDDRSMGEFDLSLLGDVQDHGTNGNAGRSGWAILFGACKLNVDDILPLRADLESNE